MMRSARLITARTATARTTTFGAMSTVKRSTATGRGEKDHKHDHHHHGIFHSHDHGGESHVVEALSRHDRGSRITLIGLGANTGLTIAKGGAGIMMNSASLLADAGHSLSDLLSDFVTLYTFKMSRKAPDAKYPYGYGKWETIGSIMVSSLLILGAIGIARHSYDLLLMLMTPETTTAAAHSHEHEAETKGMLSNLLFHSHSHEGVLNPNAAWFALASVVIKEWLFQATKKVAVEEKSDVLLANAWHHRSDAFSSMVAVAAIGLAHYGFPAVDPIGGLLVAGMILKTGVSIGSRALSELVDVSLPAETLENISHAIKDTQASNSALIGFSRVRGVKAGGYYLIDVVLKLDGTLQLQDAHTIEADVRREIMSRVKMVREVRCHLHVEGESDGDEPHNRKHEHEHHENGHGHPHSQ